MILHKLHPAIVKTVIYQTNGSGRDSYIYNNSGGFCAEKKNNNYSRSTFPSHRTFHRTNNEIEGMQIIYKSDGTGRDSYIK